MYQIIETTPISCFRFSTNGNLLTTKITFNIYIYVCVCVGGGGGGVHYCYIFDRGIYLFIYNNNNKYESLSIKA